MTLSAILAFRFVTASLEAAAAFYIGLGFTAGVVEAIPADEMALLGLAGTGRRLPLRLGGQRLDLDCFEHAGAPYPPDVTGNDTRFQHIALVTSDAAAAWRHAQALGARAISMGAPVKLPQSSGGVIAIKFRDPEGHPLELLQFPARASDWVGEGILGIDHSAISVAESTPSQIFYEELGLAVDGPTLNQGATQAHLDGLDGVVVDVLPMKPREPGPHLELLAYRLPAAFHTSVPAVHDIAATRIVWSADRDTLVRDPDGHLHQLVCTRGAS